MLGLNGPTKLKKQIQNHRSTEVIHAEEYIIRNNVQTTNFIYNVYNALKRIYNSLTRKRICITRKIGKLCSNSSPYPFHFLGYEELIPQNPV